MAKVEGEAEVNVSNLASVSGSAYVEPEVLGDREVQADLVRKRIIELRDAVASSYFELGRHLYHVQKEALYQLWGYDSFGDYVDGEVTFAWRKAMYLMRIYRYFALELGNKQVFDKVRELGWSKAAALVEVVDAKNVDVWVEKAAVMPVKKLEDEARLAKKAKADRKKERATGRVTQTNEDNEAAERHADAEARKGNALYTEGERDADPPPGTVVHRPLDDERQGADPVSDDEPRLRRHNFTVKVSDDQKGNVELAMSLANDLIDDGESRQNKEKNRDAGGMLLDHISTSFIASYNGSVRESKVKHRANFRFEMLRSVERSLGVKIVALDEETNDVVFGQETVDDFSAEDEEG